MAIVHGPSEDYSFNCCFHNTMADAGCSSEDEGSLDGDGDMPMDENLPEGRAKPAAKEPGDLSEYKLDTYDEDDANEAELGPFTNIKGLTYHRNNEEDPYITLKDVSASITITPSHSIFTRLVAHRTMKMKMSETNSRFYLQITS